MKINNPTIINKTNITEQAVEELINESFTNISPIYEYKELEVEYTDFVDDIIVDEKGVSLPTLYKRTYKGSNSIDDQDEYEPSDYEVKFTPEELKLKVQEIIENEYPEAFNELANVQVKN